LKLWRDEGRIFSKETYMSDVINFFQSHPFYLGLVIGLLLVFFTWIKGILRAMSLRKEIKQLKESMYTKMKVETKGQLALGDEIDHLRNENENLRVSVKSLLQKPGRAEIRQLHIYDKAIRSLLGKSPGFGPAWEMVLRESEEDFRQSETGLRAFIRQVFSPVILQQIPGKKVTETEFKSSKDDSES
jgi:hypothetical protein